CLDRVYGLSEAPETGGLHFLQVQNVDGLFSNDMMFFSEQAPVPVRDGNIITSGGSFNAGNFDRGWNAVETAIDRISESGGQLHVETRQSDQPWHAQISHSILLIGGHEYTICYRARADGNRNIATYTDTNLDSYINTSGGQFEVNLTTSFQNFQHTFTVAQTDLRGRVAFDLSQSDQNVHFDHVGVFEGTSCGTP
ncbi:MAG: carbohydrate binding domain-containing protein, partial [Pseudomonadota bacterium]